MLTAEKLDIRPALLIPVLARHAYTGASFAATGRGWRHPSPTGRRSGARKESEMARAPGGSLRRLVRGASNGAQAASSRRPLRFERDRPDQRAGLIRSGTENRRRAGT